MKVHIKEEGFLLKLRVEKPKTTQDVDNFIADLSTILKVAFCPPEDDNISLQIKEPVNEK